MIVTFMYSYVSNKRACAFILFENLLPPCTALFEPARLLILGETILPARLLKPAPFWILVLVVSKKCRICYQNVAATQVQQPRTKLNKKSHINLRFRASLLEIHLPCTIIWDTFNLHLYLLCNPTLLFKPARLLNLEDFSSLPFYYSLRLC